jgi:hypothetical protein
MGLVDDYRDVARRLNERVDHLVRELLPRGYRDGRFWRVGSLAGDEGQSLAIKLWGPYQGRWFDYGAGIGGDGLDLVAGVGFNNDKRQAFRWSRDWLRLPPRELSPAAKRAAYRPRQDYGAAIKRIWGETYTLRRGDPVDRYLRGRGIVLAELGKAPRALRYHPRLWNSQTKSTWPAMVAAISSPAGELTAVHCTWLSVDAIAVCKAPIPDRHGPTGGAKRTIGSYRGGGIKLWHGTQRQICMVGEGIEDTLSAVFNCPAWRAVCGVSLSSMLVLELAQEITTVVILGQNDVRGSDADKLLVRVTRRWIEEGRAVRLAKPPAFLKDWNELAQWCRAKGTNIAWADWS